MFSVTELHNKTEDCELHLSKTGNRSNCKNVLCYEFYRDFFIVGQFIDKN
jgi:hypothetical protein